MAAFNRNVITRSDIVTLENATTPAELPKTLDTNPPAGAVPPVAGGAAAPAAPAALGGVTVPTADDYLTKLLKYVPLEILGAYLFLAGVIDSNVTKPGDHAYWLAGLLIGILLITIPYDMRVLSVVRPAQIFMSLLGLTVYVFAVGGWFATTSWYKPWYATLLLPMFGLLVAIIKLKPLPAVGD